MTNNWNGLYNGELPALYSLIPDSTQYQDEFGVMYWQWANAYITESTLSAPSVAVISAASGANTVAGYFEISYFHSAYFNTSAN